MKTRMKSNFNPAIILFALCATLWLVSSSVLYAQTGSLLAQVPMDSSAIRQVDSLIQEARTFTGKKEMDKALAAIAKAETVAIEKFGRESALYGLCCYNHAKILLSNKKYEDVLKWGFEALAIQEKAIGKTDYDYGNTLLTIAATYFNLYQFENGIAYALEAKAIFEKTVGKGDMQYLKALNTLAVCYAQMGQFELAEPLFLEGLDLAQAKGKENEYYALLLGNLSHFYLLMGNFQKSLQFSLEATTLKRKLYGEDTPDYANGLPNLASAYVKLGDFSKAEPLYLQSLAILEKTYGKEDQDYVEVLQWLATMYSTMQQHQKAVPLFLEVLATKEKILGKENWGYGIGANNLAVEYMAMGEWEKAEPLLLESIEIDKKLDRVGHPAYANSLNSLAILYKNLGRYEASAVLYAEISDRLQAAMSRTLHHLSEKEIQEYLQRYTSFQNYALSLAQVTSSKQPSGTTALAGTCYDNALYFKGFLLNAATRARNTAAANPNNAEQLNLLKSVERRLGNAYSQALAERDSATVASLEAQANDLEKSLARNIVGYADATRSVKWQDVQKRLQPSEAAIEFVRFIFYDKTWYTSDSVCYTALVIRPGNNQPQLIPLFEERDIAALFKNKGARKSDYVNTLYANPAQTAGQQKNLYQAIWQPLETALGGAKTVYFSPAGLLHRINFNAITDKGGKPLGDRLNLVQLGSTRQLALPEPTINAALSSEVRLFGGINYEPDTLNNPGIEVKSTVEPEYTGTRGGLSFEDADSTLRGGTWGYLPWTDKEVMSLQPVLKQAGLKPIVSRGWEASEETFKSIGVGGASPRVLHLATHGFFFPDPQRMTQQTGTDENVFQSATNPMMRSGLILAGGNYAWKTGKPFRPDQEDGIITAYEISQMNLSNTELVVLSACETGLGDIEGNEGVYGLQRAFKIAGAQYIIMSLWQVPDAQTQELMTAFYTNWLSRKMAIPEAFRAAQKTMQEKYEHPFFWAGFILLR